MTLKRLRLPIAILFATMALYACVLIPLLQYLINDVVLRSTLWLDALDLLSRHIEIVGSILLLEFLIFAVYRCSRKELRSLLIPAAGALGFKYLASVIAYSVLFGSLDLTGGLTPYLVSFLLELLLAAATVLLSARLISPVKDTYAARKAAAKTLQQELDEKDPCYPFESLFPRKNPVLKMTLLCVLAVFLLQSGAFVISFVSGAPMQSSDIPVLFIYEGMLILLPCAYSYFLARLFFRLCMKKSNRPLPPEDDTNQT